MSVTAIKVAGIILLVVSLVAVGDDYRLRAEVQALRQQIALDQSQRQAAIDAAARALIRVNAGNTKPTKEDL